MSQKLSIVIPVYNEEKLVSVILKQIHKIKLPDNLEKEVVVVNDASTDKTDETILQFQKENPDFPITYVKHEKNKGKGAAIHTGIEKVTGDFTIIQDADLEYDPREYPILLQPMLDGFADVVYGSRFMGGKPHRILFFWHSIGNYVLTFLSNMCSDLNLTDMETCYKLFRTEILKKIKLKEKRFGFEPEITAKIAKIEEIRLYEVGISYYGRTYREGKKISWKDGFRAIYCIIKYNLFTRAPKKES